jgi:lipopolysaccharide export system protein LptA
MSLSVAALSTDKDKPMEIEADRVDVDEKAGYSTFSGNVIITKGSIRLTAENVVVHQKNDTLHKVIAKGKPAKYKHRPDGKKEDVHAQANTIEYFNQKNLVHLISNAKIIQGKDTFTGDRIDYDANKDVILARSSPESKQRVKITIQTDKKNK